MGGLLGADMASLLSSGAGLKLKTGFLVIIKKPT